MNEYYEDIISKIAEAPTWFDENAVPRYCAYEPQRSANIYATEAALVEITCQDCGHIFHVAFTKSTGMNKLENTIAEEIQTKTLHYGDPPNINCCAAGPTMNSEPRRVLQYWRRFDSQYIADGKVTDTAYFHWKRDPTLEIAIDPNWIQTKPAADG